ncbi:MAG: DUF2147 domain-containing protein [Candidatus Devosia phytovorans]|uniref:DUF2147 domain-containing protein n=1 Tax=Candidatus Devosia phytovorans TaxID=3121372 RepID=A0AAJ5VXP8_9HYPH|nr:DUF2147 domain-containing protein [Devosia sp.]WEK05387.1 MAG: DUF2147 domain-containing protein [Devosia sp.]
MRKIVGLLATLSLMIGSAGAASASPNGIWELDSRDTRVQLELCGDGTQICGQLVWLSDADYNQRYQKYLNAPIATGLRQTSGNEWKGKITFMGVNLNGGVIQHSEDHMTLSGCALLVVCKSYEMYRVSN